MALLGNLTRIRRGRRTRASAPWKVLHIRQRIHVGPAGAQETAEEEQASYDPVVEPPEGSAEEEQPTFDPEDGPTAGTGSLDMLRGGAHIPIPHGGAELHRHPSMSPTASPARPRSALLADPQNHVVIDFSKFWSFLGSLV